MGATATSEATAAAGGTAVGVAAHPSLPSHVRPIFNTRELENWDPCNELSFNVLDLSTNGAAKSFFLRFQSKGSEKTNGKRAWEGLTSKNIKILRSKDAAF